jgi:hypothetical protein
MLKFRPIAANDELLLEKWLVADDEHSKTSNLSFWLPPKDASQKHKGTDYVAVEDEIGTIGYLKMENILRIHCQFAPPTEIQRTRKAMAEFINHIKQEARPQYAQLIFESVSAPLIWFLRKFGFRRSKNEIVCNLNLGVN